MYHLLQSVARSSVWVYVCTYDDDPHLTHNPNWTFHGLSFTHIHIWSCHSTCMSPHLHWHQSTLSVHSSPNSFQSVHLVSVTYTLPLSHIYIQAPVRLAEPMWVEHTSHLLGIYIHMTFWSPQVEKLQVKVIPFCELVWPLACWLKPAMLFLC